VRDLAPDLEEPPDDDVGELLDPEAEGEPPFVPPLFTGSSWTGNVD